MDRFLFNELAGLRRISRDLIAKVRAPGTSSVASSDAGARSTSSFSEEFTTEGEDGGARHVAIYGLDVYNDPNSVYGRDK